MGECRHLVAHWTTAVTRAQILDGIDYARRVRDLAGLSSAAVA
ncbi:hypothetical protein [Yinghuangia seranimata]|nr:hypothetical protein [Yinghuangia seranimata]MDI2130586.1 hypothetical protein [Yinghuangia seranimata]